MSRCPHQKLPQYLHLAPAAPLTKSVQEGSLRFHPKHQRHNNTNKLIILRQHQSPAKQEKQTGKSSVDPTPNKIPDTQLEGISNF